MVARGGKIRKSSPLSGVISGGPRSGRASLPTVTSTVSGVRRSFTTVSAADDLAPEVCMSMTMGWTSSASAGAASKVAPAISSAARRGRLSIKPLPLGDLSCAASHEGGVSHVRRRRAVPDPPPPLDQTLAERVISTLSW